MKPPTVFLGELTNPEVEAFLQTGRTVIIPTGAVEQHGPHAPLIRPDVIIPQEIARRIAPRIRALVAPPVNYALSYPRGVQASCTSAYRRSWRSLRICASASPPPASNGSFF
jgi:creatinine amidohydrolase/Fe(II)-dependent formamide hydrolase-like protein